MKVITFIANRQRHLGVIQGQDVINLNALDKKLPRELGAYLRGGGKLSALKALAKKAKGKHMHALSRVKLDLPLTDPGKIFCLGLNYVEHAKEGTNPPTEYPTIFMRGRTSLVAHKQAIIRPKASTKLDYEAELAVIIGKKIRHATKENALKAVAGYACFNDGSVRDFQRRTTQWTMGKNFDATGGFGPWIVSADALPAGAVGLKIQSRLNGQVMQSDNTSNMMHPVAHTISVISEAVTLEPGDVIVMGTPSGVGFARNPPAFMKDGDVCEIEIEGIGTLVNPIKDEA